MRARIDAVFKITIRTVRETIPKLIGYFLVRMSQDKLQGELYQRINENDTILDSLGEPKHISERRRTLNEIIKTLKESLKVSYLVRHLKTTEGILREKFKIYRENWEKAMKRFSFTAEKVKNEAEEADKLAA